MTTLYPTALQDLDASRGQSGNPLSSPNHVTHHTTEDDTIEALQAKVGIDSSADTSTLDYKLKNVNSLDPGHKHSTAGVDSTFNGMKMFRGYAADSGSANTYVISAPGGSPGSYTAGDTYVVKIATANSGASTLNVNSLGAKTIKKNISQDLISGDLAVGQVIEVCYDGTNFQIISPLSSPTASSGGLSKDISLTTSSVIAHGLGVIPRVVNVRGGFGNTITASSAFAFWTNGSGAFYNHVGTKLSATVVAETGSGFRLRSQWSPSSEDYLEISSFTVDATNITLAWTKTNTPTGTAQLIWEAFT